MPGAKGRFNSTFRNDGAARLQDPETDGGEGNKTDVSVSVMKAEGLG